MEIRKAFSLKQNWQKLTRPSSGDIAAIDGLRALALFSVVFFHVLHGLCFLLEKDDLQRFVDSWPLWLNFFWQGDKGVDIFFVVSGFLIGRLLFSNAHGNTSTMEFYRDRLLRIMPIYAFAVVLLAMRDLDKYLLQIPINLLFLEHILPQGKDILRGGWSLGVEMHFYLLVPLLAAVLMAKPEKALRVLTALLLLSILARVLYLFFYPANYQIPLWAVYFRDPASDSFSLSFYYLLPFRATPLIAGLWLAWLATDRYSNWRRYWFTPPRARVVALFGLALVAIPIWPAIHNPTSAFSEPFSSVRQFAWLAFHRPIFSIGIACIAAAAIFQPSSVLRSVLSLRFFRPFSQMALPLYLFHIPLMFGAAYLYYGKVEKGMVIQIADVFAVWALTIALVTIFSILVHLLLERPVMNLRPRKS